MNYEQTELPIIDERKLYGMHPAWFRPFYWEG